MSCNPGNDRGRERSGPIRHWAVRTGTVTSFATDKQVTSGTRESLLRAVALKKPFTCREPEVLWWA